MVEPAGADSVAEAIMEAEVRWAVFLQNEKNLEGLEGYLDKR